MPTKSTSQQKVRCKQQCKQWCKLVTTGVNELDTGANTLGRCMWRKQRVCLHHMRGANQLQTGASWLARACTGLHLFPPTVCTCLFPYAVVRKNSWCKHLSLRAPACTCFTVSANTCCLHLTGDRCKSSANFLSMF